MTDQATTFFFADYVLDMAVRELRHGNQTVPLQPRVLDLLYFLVSNRERALDKDAIQEAVWSGRIVSETALTRAIMKARRAIGDSAESQHLIRTVHGHGYQFVGEVFDTDPALPPSVDQVPAADSQAPARSTQSNVRLGGLGIVVAVLALLAIGIFVFKPASPPTDGIRIAVLPISDTTQSEKFAWASLGLMGYANDLLGAATTLDTVRPADVVRYTDTAQWTATPAQSDVDEHVVQLRRRYGATHVLLSELARNAGGLRLRFTLLDSQGVVTDGSMVNAQSTELIKGMVRGVTVALTKKRHVRDPEISIADDPFVDEAYARARSLSIEGRCSEALPLYDVVIDSAGDTPGVTLQRATCSRILGHWQDAESSFASLLDTMGAAADPSLKANALSGLGIVLHRTGRHDEAAARYDAGLSFAQASGDRVAEGRVLINRAILAKDQGRFDDARNDLARASVAYRDAGYDVLPGHIATTQANIAMNDGKLDQAERYIRQATESFRQLGDRLNEAKTINNLGYLRRQQGRYDEALPLHQQSLAIRREIGDRVGQGRILGMLSTLYARQRRFDESLEAATEALAIAREARDALFIATGLAHRGSALRSLSRYDEARAAFVESAAQFESINDASRAAQARLLLAAVDLDAERFAQAEEAFIAIQKDTADRQLHEPHIEALKLRGELAAARGESERAVEFYTAALKHIDETGFAPGLARQINVALANLHLDAGDISAAEPHLGTVLDGPSDLLVARLQARYAFETGDKRRATTLLEAAKASAGSAWQSQDEVTLVSYRQSN